jgi:protein TonB
MKIDRTEIASNIIAFALTAGTLFALTQASTLFEGAPGTPSEQNIELALDMPAEATQEPPATQPEPPKTEESKPEEPKPEEPKPEPLKPEEPPPTPEPPQPDPPPPPVEPPPPPPEPVPEPVPALTPPPEPPPPLPANPPEPKPPEPPKPKPPTPPKPKPAEPKPPAPHASSRSSETDVRPRAAAGEARPGAAAASSGASASSAGLINQLRACLRASARYPTSKEARLQHPEGSVGIALSITAGGQVSSVSVVSSSGSSILDQAALSSARQSNCGHLLGGSAWQGTATLVFNSR